MKKKLLFSTSALAFMVTCSHGQIFQDNFEAPSLAVNAEPNLNLDVPARQTGDITGNWIGYGGVNNGTLASSARYLIGAPGVFGGEFLDGGALMTDSRVVQVTGVSIPSIRSTNLGTPLNGTAYTFSGSLALLDTGGNSMSTFGNAGNDATSNFVEGSLLLGIKDDISSGLNFNIHTTDLNTWAAQVNDGATEIDTIALPNFGTGMRLDFSLDFDETGANDLVSGTFDYGSESISFSNIAFDFDDETTRELMFGSRLATNATGTDYVAGSYALTAHADNFTVVPEPAAYALGLGLAALMLGLTRRVKYRKN